MNKEEEKELKIQFYYILLKMGVGFSFFMIPGSTVLVPFVLKLAKKLGVDTLPKSFKKKDD